MELEEAIAKRHSYRGPMDTQPVPRDHLITIVEAGIRAPSGKNAQTTEFVIIDDPAVVQQINAMHPANKAMNQAPAMIACVIDKQPQAVYKGYNFQIEDCAAAVENMLLTITGLGYASVWIDGWLRIDNHAAKLAQLLRLPEHKKIQIILPVGIPLEQWPPKERKPFASRACFNTYTLNGEQH